MRQKSVPTKEPAEEVIKGIRRATLSPREELRHVCFGKFERLNCCQFCTSRHALHLIPGTARAHRTQLRPSSTVQSVTFRI